MDKNILLKSVDKEHRLLYFIEYTNEQFTHANRYMHMPISKLRKSGYECANFKADYDGSFIYNGNRYKNCKNLLEGKAEAVSKEYIAGFIDNLRIMSETSRNIIKIDTNDKKVVYVTLDELNNVVIGVPDDVKEIGDWAPKLSLKLKNSNIVFNTITFIGGGPKLKSLNYLLSQCRAQRVDMDKLDISKVITAAGMFSHANIEEIELSWSHRCKIKTMYRMFRFYWGESVPLYQMNVKHVESTEEMFEGANTAIDFSGMSTKCTPALVKTAKMFYIYSNKRQLLWLKWMDMSKVTDTTQMFGETQANGIDISNWDVSSVEMASSMFCLCRCAVKGLSSDTHESGGLNWASLKCMDKMFCKVLWHFSVEMIAENGTVHNVDRAFIESTIDRINLLRLNLNKIARIDAKNMFNLTKGRLYITQSMANKMAMRASTGIKLDIYVERD